MSSNSYRCFVILTAIVVFPWASLAQSSAGQTEVTSGGYAIHQTIEAGFRFSDQTGNNAMYDSLVNLQTGPRILEQTLSMQSLTHESLLFDNLYVNSFGWGGDPNNVFRARLDKSKWYKFSANFRRDLNRFDYDLLANPLNPANSNPNVPVLDSPHQMMLTRRMTDLNLHLLPQSFVSFRLGWARVVNEGSAFTSIHQGTDTQLNQATRDTNDNYQFGISLRALPRTSINYDHFYTYFRGDSIAALNALPYRLAGGTAVDLGLPFNTPAGQPCATPILSTGFVNPACNAFLAYNRFPQTRNSIHTDQIGLQSNYFHRLDFSGRFAYSDAQSKMPAFVEFFNGLITRSRTRTSLQAGSGSTKRLSANADFGLTLRLTERFRIVDTFRFDNFRIPGGWNLATAALFGATLLSKPNQFNPATCPPPFTAATCPQHNSSSGADLTADLFNSSLRQDQKLNTIQAEYDFSKRFTGRLGYRYSRRNIVHNSSDFQTLVFYPTLPNRGACAGQPLLNGVCTIMTGEDVFEPPVEINGHSGLAGFSARPTGTIRVLFDAELFSADHSFLRISPRKEARFRLQANFTPRPWAVLSASANVLQNSNRDLLTDYRGHNRNYGFTASLSPRERFAIDLAYNYNDYLQNALICFANTDLTLSVVTNARSCMPNLDPANLFNDSSNPLLTDSYYVNKTHFGMGAVMFKPVKRVTTQAGYSVTSVGGKSPVFNSLQPDGALHYNYHQPLAIVAIELRRDLTWNAGWNYYQYNEKSFVGPTAARYFQANNATVSLRYSF